MKKYVVNKCDKSGNIITGYQEVLIGDTKEEVEFDYRSYYEMTDNEFVDVEEIEIQGQEGEHP